MRLCPYPSGVDEPDPSADVALALLFEPADAVKAERHEFTALELASDPLPGILMPSAAPATLMEGRLGGDAAGHVRLRC